MNKRDRMINRWRFDLQQFGETVLRDRRTKDLGLTQVEMAELIGVSQSAIHRYEVTGTRPKDLPTAELVAFRYALNMDEAEEYFRLAFGVPGDQDDVSDQLNLLIPDLPCKFSRQKTELEKYYTIEAGSIRFRNGKDFNEIVWEIWQRLSYDASEYQTAYLLLETLRGNRSIFSAGGSGASAFPFAIRRALTMSRDEEESLLEAWCEDLADPFAYHPSLIARPIRKPWIRHIYLEDIWIGLTVEFNP